VQMARLIKDMVLKIIQDEKRLGGALRRGWNYGIWNS
jgi:hypothetical protein